MRGVQSCIPRCSTNDVAAKAANLGYNPLPKCKIWTEWHTFENSTFRLAAVKISSLGLPFQWRETQNKHPILMVCTSCARHCTSAETMWTWRAKPRKQIIIFVDQLPVVFLDFLAYFVTKHTPTLEVHPFIRPASKPSCLWAKLSVVHNVVHNVVNGIVTLFAVHSVIHNTKL